MSTIYNIGIKLVKFSLKCIAPFNSKIKKGVLGRQETFKILKQNISKSDKTLWFHCASLGEYEQGLPVFKALRLHYKSHKIVLSFFSPSGYEIRENTPVADCVVYLPIDTTYNANKFIELVKPELTVFVKYDIWPNYLNAIKTKQLRAILISAAFRKNQSFFKPYGKLLRDSLFTFEHIFTQNKTSKDLLQTINYTTTTITGDTRFDRVFDQLSQNNILTVIEKFKQNKTCIVAGSTWPEDENLLTTYINKQQDKNIKFIIAPHNIKENQINNLKSNLQVETILFSEKENTPKLTNANVLIIDNIGLLTKIYNYADVAYVGGAMGNTGLHNTLEPAVFATPVIIGNNHHKFPEAQALINYGGMYSISNQIELNTILDKLLKNEEKRIEMGNKSYEFINKNKGAVSQIIDYLRI